MTGLQIALNGSSSKDRLNTKNVKRVGRDVVAAQALWFTTSRR